MKKQVTNKVARTDFNIYMHPEMFDRQQLRKNVQNDEDIKCLDEYLEDPEIQEKLDAMR